MKNTKNIKPVRKQKLSLKQIHNTITSEPARIRAEIKHQLGFKSDVPVFNIINGTRICNQVERTAIAAIYGKSVTEIAWAEKRKTTLA